jgi:hypothetical protein
VHDCNDISCRAPSLLFTWKRRMLEGGCEAVAADEDVVGTSKVRDTSCGQQRQTDFREDRVRCTRAS